MLLRVYFRQIETADLGQDCPFFPEEGEYERRFQNACEDIERIEGVTSVETSDNNQITVSIYGMDMKDFRAALKPILQDHFASLRISLPIDVIG